MTDVRSRTVTAELAVWDFASQGSQEWAAVRLPHDAMIGERRTPDADGGPDTGYFPGGKYTYRTVWAAPHEPLPFVALRFDGVQGEATVDVNGVRVGSLRSGYTEFELPFHNALRWGADNEIVVSVDNSAQPNGRWYPGSGLYRRVQIIAGPAEARRALAWAADPNPHFDTRVRGPRRRLSAHQRAAEIARGRRGSRDD